MKTHYYYYYYYYYLPILCRVFGNMYLKQTMFIGYIVLKLFCIYVLCYMQCHFAS